MKHTYITTISQRYDSSTLLSVVSLFEEKKARFVSEEAGALSFAALKKKDASLGSFLSVSSETNHSSFEQQEELFVYLFGRMVLTTLLVEQEPPEDGLFRRNTQKRTAQKNKKNHCFEQKKRTERFFF